LKQNIGTFEEGEAMREDYLIINYMGKRNKMINELISEHLNSLSEEKRKYCLEKLISMAKKNMDFNEYSAYRKKIKNKNISFVDISEKSFPPQLKKIYDPPLVLFYEGNLEILNKRPCVAIVGSRKCSNYGRQVAYDFAKRLSRAGISVISGMAYGIDSSAHIGALTGQGSTVAVMGTGIDICYPAKNRSLHEQISKRGLLLTEFGLGVNPLPYNFPRRNRIISGLCDALIVIEAGLKSGALITADFALEQGKDVYAVPSGIMGNYGKGSNKLIKEGAECLVDIEEVIDIYAKADNSTPLEKMAETILTESERKLLEIIEDESPVHIDRLFSYEIMGVNEMKGALMMLMIKDKIYLEPGDKYCIKQ